MLFWVNLPGQSFCSSSLYVGLFEKSEGGLGDLQRKLRSGWHLNSSSVLLFDDLPFSARSHQDLPWLERLPLDQYFTLQRFRLQVYGVGGRRLRVFIKPQGREGGLEKKGVICRARKTSGLRVVDKTFVTFILKYILNGLCNYEGLNEMPTITCLLFLYNSSRPVLRKCNERRHQLYQKYFVSYLEK